MSIPGSLQQMATILLGVAPMLVHSQFFITSLGYQLIDHKLSTPGGLIQIATIRFGVVLICMLFLYLCQINMDLYNTKSLNLNSWGTN